MSWKVSEEAGAVQPKASLKRRSSSSLRSSPRIQGADEYHVAPEDQRKNQRETEFSSTRGSMHHWDDPGGQQPLLPWHIFYNPYCGGSFWKGFLIL